MKNVFSLFHFAFLWVIVASLLINIDWSISILIEWHLYVSPRNCLLIASAHIFCSYHFLFIWIYIFMLLCFLSLLIFYYIFSNIKWFIYLWHFLLSSIVNHISSFVFLYPSNISCYVNFSLFQQILFCSAFTGVLFQNFHRFPLYP